MEVGVEREKVKRGLPPYDNYIISLSNIARNASSATS